METSFSLLKVSGGFLLPWKPEFWSNLPQNLLQHSPPPNPNDATHKIWSRLTNWLQRYSSSKVWNFRPSRASNSKMRGLIRPKIKLDRAFMPVLVTSNVDDDLIKNKRASMETAFSHYKSMGNFFRRSRVANSVVSSPIWPKFELVRNLCMSSFPASIKRIGSKATEKRWRHPFPHYKSMGAFCYHWHQSFDQICLKTLCSLSPHNDVTHKIWSRLTNWPQRYSSSKM